MSSHSFGQSPPPTAESPTMRATFASPALASPALASSPAFASSPFIAFASVIMLAMTVATTSRVLAVDVEVTPLGGKPLVGELLTWNSDRLTLRTAEGQREFASAALQTVRLSLSTSGSATGTPAANPVATPATAAATAAGGTQSENAELKPGAAQVELADGSRLTVDSFTTKSGKATGQLVGGQSYEFRVRAIRSVRFAPAGAAFAEAWNAQLETKIDGDTIVIRRKAKSDGPATLDRQAGIVQEVTAETIQFELDGDRIPVKRERLEGILFFQPADREWPDPVCRLDDRRGASWRVKSFRLEGTDLSLETVAGATATLPLAELRTADFSSGNVQFLSDLEPDSVEWTPFIQSKLASLARFNQPRRDVWPGGVPLAAGGETFGKGIAIRSRTNLVYRVPRNFRRFEAQVGIDERLKEYGAVKLTILGDGKPLLETPIAGTDKLLNVSLDVSSVRRLAILVDFGEEGDRADWLVLGNARVTK